MDLSTELKDTPLKLLFFNKGFNITGYECAKILDISERYLFESLKPSFDYVKVKGGATKCFKEEYYLEDAREIEGQLTELRAKYLVNNDAYRKFLIKKRIFISREGFKEYLRNDLKRVIEYKRLVLPNELIPTNLTKGEILYVLSELPVVGAPITEELPDDLIDKLIAGDLTLYSPKSLKKKVAVDGLTVYDTQLYRWLNSRANVIKLSLSTVSDKAPVIRYLIDAKEFAYFNNFNTYSIDSRCYYVGIEGDILRKLYDLSEEKKRNKTEGKED